jgi:DNA-binding MarR family transcriptional regulator
MGRPPYDRSQLMDFLLTCPRQGRRLVRLNERKAAVRLGWHRSTVKKALDDLEEAGVVRRFSSLGHQGILVLLLG